MREHGRNQQRRGGPPDERIAARKMPGVGRKCDDVKRERDDVQLPVGAK
jgi:hypothetical protein